MTGLGIDVPGGASNGDVVTLRGFGIGGFGGGALGDLNVLTSVAPGHRRAANGRKSGAGSAKPGKAAADPIP